jgi:thiamine-phosphate pyrophosphorylase
MTPSKLLQGLYVITDDTLCAENLAAAVTAAIDGGATLVQYRSKRGSAAQREQQARQLLDICRARQVAFLINDDPLLAKTIGADGVHLGQSDSRLAEARTLLGPEAIIGITCHASLELALLAEKQGADYVALGRFFDSHTKPEAPAADIRILEQAKKQLVIPVCAIGGITPENAPRLIKAGADMLAVIHGVFAQPNIKDAVRLYADVLQSCKDS